MNRLPRNPNMASLSCDARAAGAFSQAAFGRASEAPSALVVFRAFRLSHARREVSL